MLRTVGLEQTSAPPLRLVSEGRTPHFGKSKDVGKCEYCTKRGLERLTSRTCHYGRPLSLATAHDSISTPRNFPTAFYPKTFSSLHCMFRIPEDIQPRLHKKIQLEHFLPSFSLLSKINKIPGPSQEATIFGNPLGQRD